MTMHAVSVLLFTSLACAGQARTMQPRTSLADLLMKTNPQLAFHAPIGRTQRQSREKPFTSDAGVDTTLRTRIGELKMDDDKPVKPITDTEAIVGAAAIGALAGVQLTGELTAALILGAAAAYSATLSNDLGKAVKKGGTMAAEALERGKEINEQYDILPKAKQATDTVVTVADNINKNYGITDKLDKQLMLSDKAEEVKSKVGGTFDQVKASVDDFKAKSSSK